MADDTAEAGLDVEAGAEATDHGDDTWSDSARSEIHKLREEAKKTRAELKPFKELFNDPNGKLFHDAAIAYKAGRMDDVAGFLIGSTANLMGKDQAALVEFLEAGGDPEDLTGEEGEAPPTRAEINKMLAEAKAEVRAEVSKERESGQVEEIFVAAEGLGYQRGTADFRRILDLAAVDFDGDLAKADKAIKDERQKIVDDYLAEKKAERDGVPKTVIGQAPAKKTRFSMDGSVAGTTSVRDAVEEYLSAQS